ncbi:MAG: protein kinase domain-containing protein [Pirellula sp.]
MNSRPLIPPSSKVFADSMWSAVGNDSSQASMAGLTGEQRDALSLLLERYLVGLETGRLESIEELTRDRADLREALQCGIDSLDHLHRMSIGWEESVDGASGSDRFPSQSTCDTADTTAGRLGDFDLEHEIGRGGMGVVYRARQRSLQRVVAIKLLPLASALTRTQIRRFQNEAEIAASLHHPHIVPVYAFGQEAGVHYYAMQWIDGESVAQWMQPRKDESETTPAHSTETDASSHSHWRACVTWGIQAADALHAAHRAGVIHRDVKPSNLLIDRDGQLWLTDFGLAGVLADHSLTRPGDIVGTMRYMSPEQARGDHAVVDGRCDIYALGVTLYEMLSGRDAFPEPSPLELLTAIESRQLPSLRSTHPDLPRDLDVVIAKAISKRREDRYETAAAFADDLQRVLDGKPTLAKAPSHLERVLVWGMRHRNAVALGLLVAGVLWVTLSTASLWLWHQQELMKELHRRSENHALLARKAVDRLGLEMAEEMKDDPATVEIRHKLLRETLNYYQDLVQLSDGDLQSRVELAATYGKLGALHSEVRATDDSIAALRNSEAIYAKLVAEHPLDLRLQWQWSVSMNNLAEALQQRPQTAPAAMEYLKKALHVQQASAYAAPETRLDRAATHNNLGLWMAEHPGHRDAVEHFEAALREVRDLPQPSLLRSSIQANLARVWMDSEPKRALAAANGAIDEWRDHQEAVMTNVRAINTLIDAYNSAGTAHWSEHRNDSAVEAWEKAKRLAESMWSRHANLESIRMAYASTLNLYGAGLSTQGKSAEAEVAFERAARLMRERLSIAPQDADAMSMLAAILNNWSVEQQSTGNPALAKRLQQEAIDWQQQAIALRPDNTQFRDFLHRQLIHRASLH